VLLSSSYAAARAEKARALFPRPSAGPLRPIVRGQTIKYNSKQKLGRGFTLEELKVGTCLSLTVTACLLPQHLIA